MKLFDTFDKVDEVKNYSNVEVMPGIKSGQIGFVLCFVTLIIICLILA